MRSFLSIFGAPALCLGVLSGVVWENGRHAKPADAAPYHLRAKAAIDGWTKTINDWQGVDRDDLPRAAIQLLRPNALFCRDYVRASRFKPTHYQLLLVQCRDPGDMSGHYPPNCYPRGGEPMIQDDARTWNVPGLTTPIVGREYHFSTGLVSPTHTKVVYNFFILPGRGICPDMTEVREASGDYQLKHYGATQVQVLFDGDTEQAARDEAFIELLAANAEVIRVLNPPGL